MATKREVLLAAAKGEGCLGKAADDEPVFVLRAQDILAPMAIRDWAYRAATRTGHRAPKVVQAEKDALEFIAWQGSKKLPD